MLCTRCAGEKKVRGPSGYDVVDCPKCRGGKLAEDELPTLRPPPKPPDDRPTTPVDFVECPACIDGKAPYESPLGVSCNPRDCAVCMAQRIVTPQARHEWIRSQKK